MKLLRGLFFEPGSDTLSSGRVVLWILLGLCIFFWIKMAVPVAVGMQALQFPASLENAFMYILIYNFFKKGVSVAHKWADNQGTRQQEIRRDPDPVDDDPYLPRR